MVVMGRRRGCSERTWRQGGGGLPVRGIGGLRASGVVVAVAEGKAVAGRGLGCGVEKEAWG